ncbi:hypothetical protein [Mucilaginibacter sp. 10I4]|uniref:hypothetical protein n=1 Tax=unclassified Mucilaginibacter TaxID=2617802 RepID=UPI0034DCC6AB
MLHADGNKVGWVNLKVSVRLEVRDSLDTKRTDYHYVNAAIAWQSQRQLDMLRLPGHYVPQQ